MSYVIESAGQYMELLEHRKFLPLFVESFYHFNDDVDAKSACKLVDALLQINFSGKEDTFKADVNLAFQNFFPSLQFDPTVYLDKERSRSSRGDLCLTLGQYVILVGEYKPYPSNGSEWAQPTLLYEQKVRWINPSSDPKSPIHSSKLFPCFNVTFRGAVMSVFALGTFPCSMDKLSDEQKTASDLLGSAVCKARNRGVLTALVLKLIRGVQQLTQFYRQANLASEALVVAEEPIDSFPCDECSYWQSSSVKREYEFVKHIHGMVFEAKVLEAKDKDKDGIIVKYVPGSFIGHEAQVHFASINLAPEILWHQTINAGLTKIVMRKVPNSITLHDLLQDENKELLKRLRPQLIHNIQEVKKKLTEAQYVHGDLRTVNIMINTSTAAVVLIDFDWAAPEGKAFYPPNVNNSAEWPKEILEEVVALRPIPHRHDTANLNKHIGHIERLLL